MPYTRNEAAARSLLPAGFEWLPFTYSGSTVYAACRRSGMDGEHRHPPHGQWGATLPLAMCGAAMRARAALAKDADQAVERGQSARFNAGWRCSVPPTMRRALAPCCRPAGPLVEDDRAWVRRFAEVWWPDA
jgi:hypothetical protein